MAFLPRKVLSVAHFHQPGGIQPRAKVIPGNCEYVELLTAGRGWCLNESEWVEVTAGTLLWHIPGDTTIGRSDGEEPYRCLAVSFESPGVGRKRRVAHVTRWPDTLAVRSFTREVVSLFVHPQMDGEALLSYVYARLFLQARLGEIQSRETRTPEVFRRVSELIDKDFDRPLSIENLARESGLSVSHFHARFRDIFGQSPHHALKMRRIRAARELLAGTDHPVKYIGAQCGFADISSFCHTFKNATGETPSTFRERQTHPFRDSVPTGVIRRDS